MTRLNREIKTIELMIDIYGKSHPEEVESCEKLKIYAVNRVENCPYGDGKPVCKNCKTHCYSSDMRDMVKTVMRYSGPRMIFHSPGLTLAHIFHGIIAKPKK